MKKNPEMRISSHKIEEIPPAEHQKAECKEIPEDLATDKTKTRRPQLERKIEHTSSIIINITREFNSKD
jgi:hypothetical protein